MQFYSTSTFVMKERQRVKERLRAIAQLMIECSHIKSVVFLVC